jgi:hypothetical protein
MWEVRVVDTAGPGGGAEHERTRPAEDPAGYVQRLRSLPAEQVIGDVVSLCSMLPRSNWERRARLLIDLATVAHEHARAYLPVQLTKQIDLVLGQLRLGQVAAEGHPSRPGKPEENDLDRVPARRQWSQPSHPPAQRPAGCGFPGADPYQRVAS